MLIVQLFIVDSLLIRLTFNLRNFLVSLWTRALSVSKVSDGIRVSFSLCPWEARTL